MLWALYCIVPSVHAMATLLHNTVLPMYLLTVCSQLPRSISAGQHVLISWSHDDICRTSKTFRSLRRRYQQTVSLPTFYNSPNFIPKRLQLDPATCKSLPSAGFGMELLIPENRQSHGQVNPEFS